MKRGLFDLQGSYESPIVMETEMSSEGILCGSGNTIEDFDFVEDKDGWLN